jgi:hypothetical protein
MTDWFSWGVIVICIFGMWVIGNAMYEAWKDSKDE